MTKPDFVCIGPEKTATTWLFSVLEGHPEVWLPPYKELRFLTEGNLVPEHSMWNLCFSTHWHCKELRRILLRNTVKMLLLRKTSGFSPLAAYSWVLRYMFGKHSFAWYDSLFSHQEGLITGDITPNYYDIPESRIQELYEHNSKTKVILFVRNPMDRAWSKALMLVCSHSGRVFEDVTEKEWVAMLDVIHQEWTPYLEVIQRWKKYFPDMYIGFFDHLKANPEQFLVEVAGYLSIDMPKHKLVTQVVGKGVGKTMPEAVRHHLIEQYKREIQDLKLLGLSPHIEQWKV